ncbi:MAG: four helix bundle protein [Saprospiraceae bacterium]
MKFGFEDLDVWKESRLLVKLIYKLTNQFPKSEQYGLTSQICRAAVSVPSNIAEGCSRVSGKEQARFTEIAYGSLMELVTQIIIANDLEYVNQEELQGIKEKARKIANQLNRLRKYQLTKKTKP